jgi:hypothetical protein
MGLRDAEWVGLCSQNDRGLGGRNVEAETFLEVEANDLVVVRVIPDRYVLPAVAHNVSAS